MRNYKGIQTNSLRKFLRLAHAWDQGQIKLLDEISKEETVKTSEILECSPRSAYDYYLALFELVSKIAEKKSKDLPKSLRIKTLKKILQISNLLIEGKFNLFYEKDEQFLLLYQLTQLFGFSSDRTTWDYYKTLLQIVILIVNREFSSENGKEEFNEYFYRDT